MSDLISTKIAGTGTETESPEAEAETLSVPEVTWDAHAGSVLEISPRAIESTQRNLIAEIEGHGRGQKEGKGFRPDTSFLGDIWVGARDFNTGAAVVMAAPELYARGELTDDIDEDWMRNRAEWEKDETQPLRAETLKEMRSLSKTDPTTYEVLSKYEDAVNAGEAEYFLERWRSFRQMAREREEAGTAGYAIGATIGIIGDMAIGMGLPVMAARSVTAAAVSASKWMAIETAIESGARELWDPSHTLKDTMMTMGVGIVGGGALGGVIHKMSTGLAARAARRAVDADEVDDLRSTGAAETQAGTDLGDESIQIDALPKSELGVTRTLSEVPVLGRLVKATRSLRGQWRSRRNVMGTRSAKVAEIHSSGDRLFTESAQTERNTRGIISSHESMEEGVAWATIERQAHIQDIHDTITTFLNDHLGPVAARLPSFMGGPVSHERIKHLSGLVAEGRRDSRNAGDKVAKLEDKVSKLQSKVDGAKTPEEAAEYSSKLRLNQSELEGARVSYQVAEEAMTSIYGTITTEGTRMGSSSAFVGLVDTVANKTDAFYEKVAKRAAKDGLIPEADNYAGYRPQQKNVEEIRANPTEVKALLWERMASRGPDEEFIAEVLEQEGRLDDITARTLGDLIEEDHLLASRVQEEWEEILLDNVEEQISRKAQDLESQFGDAARGGAEKYRASVSERYNRAVEISQEHEAKLARYLEKNPNDEGGRKEGLYQKLAKSELRAEDLRLKLEAVDELLDDGDLTALYDKLAARVYRHTDFRIGKARHDLKKAQRSLEQSRQYKLRRANVSARVDDMYLNLAGISNKEPSTFGSDFIETSGAFKRRAIDLTGVRHLPRWQKYLAQGEDEKLISYHEGVVRQMELEEKMGRTLREEGYLRDGEHDVQSAWVRWAEDKYNGALVDNPEMRDEILADRKEILGSNGEDGLLQSFLNEFTRQDRLRALDTKGGRTMDMVLRTLSTVTSSVLLRNVLVSSITDVAMGLMAPRPMSHFKAVFSNLFRGNWLGGIKNIEEVDRLQAMAIKGEHLMEQGGAMRRYDVDTVGLQRAGAGTMERRYEVVRQQVGNVAAWAQGLVPWNRFMHSSGALSAGASILKDARNHKALPDGLRAHYASARLGYNERTGINTFDAITALTDHTGVIKQMDFEVPDTADWHKLAVVFDGGVAKVVARGDVPEGAVSMSGEMVQRSYVLATRRFARQVHLDPALGDRPFWGRSNFGRLLLQFTSFMYAANDRYVVPMVQRARLWRGRYLALAGGSLMMAIGLGAAGQAARDHMAGRDSTFTKSPSKWDAEDMVEVLRVGWRRSPANPGLLDRFWEAGEIVAGDHINALLGFKLVGETPLKWRGNANVATSFLGPSIGLAGRASKTLSSPEGITLEGIAGMTPVLNALLIQAMLAAAQ